jgi:hypothetical protein
VVGAGGHTTAATTLKKEEVLEMVQKQIGNVIAFKQAQLEHKKQKVVSIDKFLKRVFKYFYLTSFLVFFSLSLGIIGYSYFAKLDLIDSFHMSSMILTGMGPVVEMKTQEAKLFSSFYALYSGVAFLSITAVFFAPIIHRLLHILHVEEDSD